MPLCFVECCGLVHTCFSFALCSDWRNFFRSATDFFSCFVSLCRSNDVALGVALEGAAGEGCVTVKFGNIQLFVFKRLIVLLSGPSAYMRTAHIGAVPFCSEACSSPVVVSCRRGHFRNSPIMGRLTHGSWSLAAVGSP